MGEWTGSNISLILLGAGGGDVTRVEGVDRVTGMRKLGQNCHS
jgi:hypothetical protein